MRGFKLAASLVMLAFWSTASLAEPLVPVKRLAISENTDLPGGDIATIFDTTLDACEAACLTNKQCQAFTFNTRNGSCFAKKGQGDPQPFDGAYSGYVIKVTKGAEDLAQLRRPELAFLPDWDIQPATALAANLANLHTTNGNTAEDMLAAARDDEMNGNFDGAYRFVGAATILDDSADNWLEYARLQLAAAENDANNASSLRDAALRATINAYLRSTNVAQQHNILVQMATALEATQRGGDGVKALRLAQAVQPRDDTAALLADAAGKYGFRVVDNQIQTDTDRPRICANFSEDLVKSGVDYATFVQLPEPGMSVSTDGYRQLCVEGIEPGGRYTVTFRAGLPAADGQTLVKSVPITAYVKDRSPGARFAGRGYVLPRTGNAAIPVVTVNTTKLDLSLYKITDRNLLRVMQDGYFDRPMYEYQEEYLRTQMGSKIWTGTATVGQTINKDVTTRLPMDEAIAGQPAGIYALRAAVSGVDPYNTAPAWQWFVVSDLGLTTLSGVDGLHVFVRSLGDATAKAGVTLQLLSAANEVLATATTDAAGYTRFDAGLITGTDGSAPALVVARIGEDTAFLSLTDPEFDLSDRGVEGNPAAPPVDVFLTTDRGAYRAGETVHATALARDSESAALTGLPLTAILSRPDGVEYVRAMSDDLGAGGHVFDFPIADTAPRGTWKMEVFGDLEAVALTSKTFLVEDFLPERIDFKLALSDDPIRLGDTPKLTIDARYLFGAPGADLAIEGEVLLRAAKSLDAWPGYVFGKHDEPFNTQVQSFSDFRTDEAGQAAIDADLPTTDDPKRPLEALFVARVAEGSGRPVERRITRLLTPSAPMIGIKPMFDEVVPEGQEATFNLVGIGPDTKATQMTVRWDLTRIETHYQWYQQDGSWNWQEVTARNRISGGDVTLGSAPVAIATPVDWGQYELVVARNDGEAAVTSTTFYAGWYAPADVTQTPDTLELSLDKPVYKAGDQAMLRIVPRAAGTALVTVMSNRLIAMKAVEVKEGENLIPLEVTDDWGTGVYVSASVLRPMDVAAGRNPARALGLSYAKIDPGTRALQASIETAPEAAPRGPLNVAVKVDGVLPGDTAFVTIAAVDQGILNLTGFTPPDPMDHYFGQRKLGIGIRDIYGRLIDGLNGAEGVVRSGGDAGAQARLKAPPPTEELVSYFAGPVAIGADGYARASFDLPSFNGTVKIMAVAWSKRGVGQANADVLVRDPVVVTASLPRFMQPGDQSRLLLEIVHATGPSGQMQLVVTSNGLTLGKVPSTLTLNDLQKTSIEIPITADPVGLQTISVVLTTPDGKVLTKDLKLPVQVNDPVVARVSRLDLAKGQTFTFDEAVFDGLMPGTGRATMAIGPIARLNAPGVLAALDAYPYGCTEQITSKALPLLYFDQVAQAMDLPGARNIKGRIEQAMTEVLQNQSSSGAFGLWEPGEGDMWLDAYVTDFLSRAKAQGFDVPDQAFRGALDNLRNQVNYFADFDKGGEPLAYALMVLAREGAAAIGDLRYYADVKGDAFATSMAMAQLGAALASYGDQPRADAMFKRAAEALKVLPKDDQYWRVDYGTNYRDTAAVLTLAVEAGSNAVDSEALTDRLASTSNLSTQEATWALLAANALIDRNGGKNITLNGEPATGPLVRVLDANYRDPVVVQNAGKKTTLTVTSFGVPTVPEPAGGNGYAITRSYYTMDGQPASLEGLRSGDRLVAVLEVTPFGKGEARLMVTDPLPAGLEIDNPNLITGGSVANLDFLDLATEVAHSEFRQDRFLTAIDRMDNLAFRLAYVLRAVSPGTFHQPAASVVDMYRPDYTAHTDAGTVTVVK
ncbi:MAG: alpha-2-macroglobulin family protein [Candidatus Saccharibacteria bacterium]|nr:alpha-2-macroglobulin family protein [Pseudorhodobacter sp.]